MPKKIKKPNFLLYHLIFWIVYPYLKLRNKVKINRVCKNIKGPVIILANHPSAADFVYSAAAVYPLRMNVVVARYYTYLKRTRKILSMLQTVPKNLFNPDNSTVKAMISIIKNNGAILLMPEGRLSSDGTNGIMPAGIEKLIKKMKVKVLIVKIKGGFLTSGKWTRSKRQGRVEVELDLLFDEDKLQNLNEEEIKKKIDLALSYNDFAWIEQEKIKFKGKSLAKGLENILYLCPECQSEFTLKSAKHDFYCENCQFRVKLNRKYQFMKDHERYKISNILEWFTYQKNIARLRYEEGSFSLATDVILKIDVKKNDKKSLQTVGQGRCILNKEGLIYQGTKNGEEIELFFPIQIMPTLLFGCNEDFEIYHDNQFYYFVPVINRLQTVKWSIYTEVAYEMFLKNN